MTTDAGLPSVRESLQLALLAEGEGSPLVDELAEAAADHYHLNYSKHPVPVLFREVRAARTLLAGVLPAGTEGTELHRQLGRLSGLLGNLAFHLDDPVGARTHLGTAVSYANRCGDTALAAWAYGAQSMVARHTGNLTAAYTYAERGAAAAPAGLVRAQLHAWALLPTLAQQGRDREAAAALDVALTELEADPAGQAPGRFGFDEPELALHQAEAHLTLGRTEQARTRAEASAAACTTGTPGWAAPPSFSRRLRPPRRRPMPRSAPWTSSTGCHPAACVPPPAPGLSAWRVCSPPAPPSTSPICVNACAPCRLLWTRPAPHRREVRRTSGRGPWSEVMEAAVGVAGLIGVEGGEPFVRSEIDHAQ